MASNWDQPPQYDQDFSVHTGAREHSEGDTSCRFWSPQSLHSLALTPQHYREFQNIASIVHAEDFVKMFSSKVFHPSEIEEKHYTRLLADDFQSWPSGNKECCWFRIVPESDKHNWYGNLMLEVYFDLFLKVFNINCYFLEVVDFTEITATTRFLLTTLEVNFPVYNPYQMGGPWFRDSTGTNWYLTDCRRFKNKGKNSEPNEIEFVIVLRNENEYKMLFEMCNWKPVNHEGANVSGRRNCKKFSREETCPYPWSVKTCYEQIKALFSQVPQQATPGIAPQH